jgi:hypothetical protein
MTRQAPETKDGVGEKGWLKEGKGVGDGEKSERTAEKEREGVEILE